LYLNKKKGELN